MPKTLVKSNDKKLFGVAGGLAEYFDTDPTVVRVGFVVLCFICAIVGLIGYAALAFLMPTPATSPPSCAVECCMKKQRIPLASASSTSIRFS